MRFAQVGPNEPVPVRHFSAIRQLARLFINPLVVILLIASAVSAWQTDRSQKAADRLRPPVAPTATVQRDGKWVEIPVRQVVPGDVFRLLAGDLVPADAGLVQR